uniref:Uncharacterized protein n=1 Tax=Phage sp. ctqZP6 TaxID=2828010 RepID=A0A8S5SIY0_9VIRU|nr:MAG TPA: hypothetical protein [Phage sp. ctqZP6]
MHACRIKVLWRHHVTYTCVHMYVYTHLRLIYCVYQAKIFSKTFQKVLKSSLLSEKYVI